MWPLLAFVLACPGWGTAPPAPASFELASPKLASLASSTLRPQPSIARAPWQDESGQDTPAQGEDRRPRNLVMRVQRDAERVEESGVELDRAEAIASYVALVMGRLGQGFVESGDVLGSDDPAALFDEESRGVLASGELVPEAARALAPAGSTAGSKEGDRAGAAAVLDWPEGAFVIEEGTGREEAIEDVLAAFAELEKTLGGRPTRPLEIAIKGVTQVPGEPDQYQVRLRVRAVRVPESTGGAGLEGSAAVAEARWLMRWRVDGDKRRIVGIASYVVRRSELDLSAGGFVDVARAVLKGPRAQALVPSIMELRSHIDAAFGVGVLGHHGVTVADINGDGLDDLYLSQPGGIANQLWLRGRMGGSVEVAGEVGLDFIDATSSSLFLDLDGDGDKDAVLAIGSGLRVFTNQGSSYEQSLYVVRSGVTGLAAADVDGDGRLDVYACAYAGPYASGSLPVPYHDAENGETNFLLMNRTERADELVFSDETLQRGLGPGAQRFSFAAAFEDVDGDADSDLYVANDFGRNALYLNDGTGHFHEAAEASGTLDIGAGMAAAFGDLNGDGAPDLYVSNMESSAGRRVTGWKDFLPGSDTSMLDLFKGHAKGNSLYLNAGGGTFESTDLATQGRWAWGSIPIDLDGNGRLDLYVPNGFVTGTGGEGPDL